MIEGARHLPWLWLTASADPGFPLLDCTTCRRDRDVEERQEMGCGYEERDPEVSKPWVHAGFPVRLLGAPSTCVGYTSKLPALLRISALGIHWERGTLLARVGGPPPEIVFDVLEEIEAQRNAARAWKTDDDEAQRRARRGR